MRKRLFVLTCLMVVSSFVQASIAPLAGFYSSSEFGGVVLNGRWSEAFPTGTEGAIGNTISAASWDGVNLGTMWEVADPAISAVPDLIGDYALGGGLTRKVYRTTYSGGTLTLKNTGPWWNVADAGTEYLLTIDSYEHITTKDYFNGVEQTFDTSVALTATFVDDPSMSVNFIIAVAVPIGSGATPAAGYPDFAVAAPGGAWGNVQKIRMDIIPEPATMVLLGLGGLLLRKRK